MKTFKIILHISLLALLITSCDPEMMKQENEEGLNIYESKIRSIGKEKIKPQNRERKNHKSNF